MNFSFSVYTLLLWELRYTHPNLPLSPHCIYLEKSCLLPNCPNCCGRYSTIDDTGKAPCYQIRPRGQEWQKEIVRGLHDNAVWTDLHLLWGQTLPAESFQSLSERCQFMDSLLGSCLLLTFPPPCEIEFTFSKTCHFKV